MFGVRRKRKKERERETKSRERELNERTMPQNKKKVSKTPK